MKAFRLFYRNVVIEAVLLIAVLVQIFSGLTLFWKSGKTAISGFDKLHRWTGLYLAIFFVIHVSSVLIGRFILHLDTNFYYGVAGLNTFPLSLFFIPYYGLAVVCFSGHVASIHNQKMKQTVFGWTPASQAKILVFGFLLTVFMLYGLTNHFQGVAIPKEYNILIGK